MNGPALELAEGRNTPEGMLQLVSLCTGRGAGSCQGAPAPKGRAAATLPMARLLHLLLRLRCVTLRWGAPLVPAKEGTLLDICPHLPADGTWVRRSTAPPVPLAPSPCPRPPQYDELGYDVRTTGFDAPIQAPSSFAQLVREMGAHEREANVWLRRREQAPTRRRRC